MEYLQLYVVKLPLKVAIYNLYRALIVICQVTTGSVTDEEIFQFILLFSFHSVCIIDLFDCYKPYVPFFNLAISHLVHNTNGLQGNDALHGTSGV